MKKLALIASIMALAVPVTSNALAQVKATAAHPKPYYGVNHSTLADLLSNPATKAILLKHASKVFGNPMIAQAGKLTPKALQKYSGQALSDETLKKIDADLAAVPAPK